MTGPDNFGLLHSVPMDPMADNDDGLARYLIRHPAEVERILREVMTARALVSAYPADGRGRLLTTLVAVDARHLDLDFGADAEMNARLASGRPVNLDTTHDGVRVQFSVPAMQQVRQAGQCVLRAPLPHELLRLQRRAYYRLATSLANPIRCRIDTGQGVVEATVVDLSVGGVGILAYAPVAPLEVGRVYPHAQLSLPGLEAFELSLAVRCLFEITLRNGRRSHRAGCQFIALPPGMEAELQRIITRMERDMRRRYV